MSGGARQIRKIVFIWFLRLNRRRVMLPTVFFMRFANEAAMVLAKLGTLWRFPSVSLEIFPV